jgi:hypothetical protein
MDYFSSTFGRIILFFSQLIVVLLCVLYITHIYTMNILPDKQAKETFDETRCTILSEKLEVKGRVFHRYRADFFITYTVDNKPYALWVNGNGLDISFTQNKREQEQIISLFDIGEMYPCWYNPENPSMVVLVQRHNWRSTFPLMVPSVVGVIAFYYMLKSFFLFFGEAKQRSRQIKKIKKK